MPMGEAGKMVDHFHVRLETGLGSFLRIRLEIVHAADAVEKLEAEARIVSQKPTDFQQILRLDHDKRVESVHFLVLDLAGELEVEKADDIVGFHGGPGSAWRRG